MGSYQELTGNFAIRELLTYQKIQVGLLNILEERDVQIRGYKVQLPLDVILVASANLKTIQTVAGSSRH